MTTAIREQVAAAFRTRLEDIENGVPVADPYTFTFDLITRRVIEPARLGGKKYVCRVSAPFERKTTIIGIPQKDARLRIVIEWWQAVETDAEPETEGNRVLADIIRKVYEDQFFDGLVGGVEEVNNSIETSPEDGRWVEGVVEFDVIYRHATTDPRVYISNP